MRICYLANAGSVHTQRWAKHFYGRGHEVFVISFQPGEIEGVRVTCLNSNTSFKRLNILMNFNKVRRLVRELSPDILHAHYATSYGLAAALTGRHPLVITAWGSDVLVMPEESWIYKQMVRFALGRADLVTSMAAHMTDYLIEKRYAAADKILTLPFGVDLNVFNLNKRTRPHLGEPCLIVSTRNLENELNVDIFIKAIPIVLRSYKNAKFMVVGNGSLRPQLEKMAVDLGVIENVQFSGHISHQEMVETLGQANIMVSTSPSDGNNISINEAMACGVFPVATDIPANRAWIKPGQNGLLFPCGDSDQLAEAIIEAVGKPEWRQEVMAQNFEIIRSKASWSESMEKIEGYYHLLEGNQQPW